MRNLKQDLFVTAILAGTALLAFPVYPALAQQSLSGESNDGDSDPRVSCMTRNALQRYVGAKGYSDVSFGQQRQQFWSVHAIKDGSLYLVIVDTCLPRIASHSKLGAA